MAGRGRHHQHLLDHRVLNYYYDILSLYTYLRTHILYITHAFIVSVTLSIFCATTIAAKVILANDNYGQFLVLFYDQDFEMRNNFMLEFGKQPNRIAPITSG